MIPQTVPCTYENFPQHIKDELARNPNGIVRGCWNCTKLFVSTPHKPHFCCKECEELYAKKQFYSYGINDKRRRINSRKKDKLVVAYYGPPGQYDEYNRDYYVSNEYQNEFVNDDLRTPTDKNLIRTLTKAPLADDQFIINIGPTMYDVRVVSSREEKINWDNIYRFEPHGKLRLFNDDGIFICVNCASKETFDDTLKYCLYCGKLHSSFWRPLYGDGYSFCCDRCKNIFKKIIDEDYDKALAWVKAREHFNHI